ncbi:hypothetical protein RRF57_002077 [Xylaria bambusicola]|uniref:Uncharacterized protein n=1 Tax=Xylaria bambusicola TaxID=326684 RepID=A0AAN7Z248_9PEZI
MDRPMAPPFYPGNHDSSQPSDTLSQPSTTPSTASDSSEHRVVVLEDSLPPVMNGVRPSEPAYAEESAIPKVKLPPHPRPGTPRQEFSPRRTTVHHSPTGGPDNLIDFGRIVVDGQKEKQRRNTS